MIKLLYIGNDSNIPHSNAERFVLEVSEEEYREALERATATPPKHTMHGRVIARCRKCVHKLGHVSYFVNPFREMYLYGFPCLVRIGEETFDSINWFETLESK